MSLESVQNYVMNTPRNASMFDEMQREDFLALASALRKRGAFEPAAPVPEVAIRLGGEPRLTFAMA